MLLAESFFNSATQKCIRCFRSLFSFVVFQLENNWCEDGGATGDFNYKPSARVPFSTKCWYIMSHIQKPQMNLYIRPFVMLSLLANISETFASSQNCFNVQLHLGKLDVF